MISEDTVVSMSEGSQLTKLDMKTRHRGYDAYYFNLGGVIELRWYDNDADTKVEHRRCKACNMSQIVEGGKEYDPCFGKLEGVENACCGHGSTEGYVSFKNGIVIRFKLIK